MSRLIVCILLAVPCGLIVTQISERFISERPLFQSSRVNRFSTKTVTVTSVTVAMFVVLAWRFSSASWIELFTYLLGFAAVLLASVIDLTEYRLPDAVVLPSLVAGIALICVVSVLDDSTDRIRDALLGSLIAFLVLLLAHLISPQGMGFGDVKFAALLGLMVGWQAGNLSDVIVLVLWFFLIGFAAGTIGGVVLVLRRGRNQPFPFGPFLAVGTFAAVTLSRVFLG